MTECIHSSSIVNSGTNNVSGGYNVSGNEFHGEANFYYAPPPQAGESFQPWTVPRDVTPLFVGRDDVLDRLKSAFPKQEPGQPASRRRGVIHGLGGTGKSELCVRFAHDVRDHYWGVFWIDCTTEAAATGSFEMIGKRCSIPDKDVKSVGSWLSSTKKSWLLIIDNADDLDLDLRMYQPSGGRGDILITTRNGNRGQSTDVFYEHLDQLAAEHATRLLLKASKLADSPAHLSQARTVVKVLDGHTLAIRTAGAYIREQYCTLAEYPSLISASDITALLRFQDNDEPSEYKSVYRTLEVSVELLKKLQQEQDQRACDASDLLQIYAFMAKDGAMGFLVSRASEMAEQILHPPVVLQQTTFVALLPLHAAILPKLSRARVRQAHRLLQSLSLIEVDVDPDPDRGHDLVSLHSVVHKWAYARLTGPVRRQAMLRACFVLRALVGFEFDPPMRPPLSATRHHITAFLTHDLDLLFKESEEIVVAPMMYHLLLFWATSTVYRTEQQTQMVVLSVALQKAAMQRWIDAETRRQSGSFAWLSARFWQANSPGPRYTVESWKHFLRTVLTIDAMLTEDDEAYLALRQAKLVEVEKTHGRQSIRYSDVQPQVAEALIVNGRSEEAIQVLLDALASAPPSRSLQSLGKTQIFLAYAYGNTGQIEAATRVLESALPDRYQKDLFTHRDTTHMHCLLGKLYMKGGYGQDAIEYLEPNIERMIQRDGPETYALKFLVDAVWVLFAHEQYGRVVALLSQSATSEAVKVGFKREETTELFAYLGMSLLLVENIREAVKVLRHVNPKLPGHEPPLAEWMVADVPRALEEAERVEAVLREEGDLESDSEDEGWIV